MKSLSMMAPLIKLRDLEIGKEKEYESHSRTLNRIFGEGGGYRVFMTFRVKLLIRKLLTVLSSVVK